MATPPAIAKTPEGYVAPAGEDLRAWLAASFKEIFGANAPTFPTTPNGMLIDFATAIAVTFFEGGAAAANSGWFAAASGVALEKILSLFAFPRIPANSSVVNLVLYGDDATVVGGGALVAAETTNLKFIVGQATNITGNVAYVVRVTAAVAGEQYTVEIDGNAHDFNSVIGTGQEIAEGLRDAIINGGQQVTAVVPPRDDPFGNWLIVVEDNGLGPFVLDVQATGAGTIDRFQAARVDALAEVPGPNEALAGTVNIIDTPVNGWVGVVNTADADLGSNAESDAAYRARHRDQLMGKGSASEQAIRDAVANLPGVTYCAVRANDTDVPDGEGLPAHSIRVTVLGGDDLLIAQTIMRKKAAGIQTWGNESEFVLDGEGLLKEIKFQRPLLKYVWIGITITKGEKFPPTGDPGAAIAAATALWGDTNISIGDDVERFQFGTPINVIPGIKGAAVTLGFTLDENDPQPPLNAVDLVMSSTDLALFDSARVLVTINP
jgi:hypothetical protein